jgi:hypothetical protein
MGVPFSGSVGVGEDELVGEEVGVGDGKGDGLGVGVAEGAVIDVEFWIRSA